MDANKNRSGAWPSSLLALRKLWPLVAVFSLIAPAALIGLVLSRMVSSQDYVIPGYRYPGEIEIIPCLSVSAGAGGRADSLVVTGTARADREFSDEWYMRCEWVLVTGQNKEQFVFGTEKQRLTGWLGFLGGRSCVLPYARVPGGGARLMLRYEVWEGPPGRGVLQAKRAVFSDHVVVKQTDGKMRLMRAPARDLEGVAEFLHSESRAGSGQAGRASAGPRIGISRDDYQGTERKVLGSM